VRLLVGGLLALAVLAGGLVGYELLHADRIYPGVEALGVELGGRTAAEAAALLSPYVEAALDAPVTLVAGDRVQTTTWRALGSQLSPAALAADALAVGRRGDPLQQLLQRWLAATQRYTVEATASLDEAVLAAFLRPLTQAVDRPPRDARLLILPDATIQYTAAQNGRQLDLSTAVAAVQAAYRQRAAAIVLPVRELPPQTPDAFRREARAVAERVLAQPLVLVHGDRQWTVERAELADWLTFEGGPGQPMVARLAPEAVTQRVAALAAAIDRPAVNARLDWNGGAPRVIRPARPGQRLDRAATQRLLLERALTDDRTIILPVDEVAPLVTEETIPALGLQELIEESRTSFAGAVPEKAHNIRLAAERLHGVVVPPGETFSFNREVGPTTLAAGYQWGFGITSGADGLRTVPAVAGGICQVATTLFQAFFWAGYPVEERHWHLYWIPAYTSRGVVGLDATVDEESHLDLRIVNTTPHAVLIQAETTADSIAFRLYGTRPDWTVEVAPPEIANRVPPDPTPVVEEDPALPAGRRIVVETAREGFEVTVVRTVTEAHGVRTLRLRSAYQPSRNVTLVGTGGAAAAGAPAESAQNRPVADRTRE
jgi:vancomycin resistance protein YoaR